MSTLKDIFENVSAGATGAAAIAGVRGALFVTSRPVPPMGEITMSPYAKTTSNKKPKKKVKVSKVTESDTFDTVTTKSLRDLLKQKQRDTELRDTTEVLALEDNDGGIVKVYIKRDQVDDFKAALQSKLADAEDEGKELAEVLYDLHRDFDIVSVDWGQGTIPEDEEQVENSVDAEEKGYPDTDELGDVEAENQGDPDSMSDDVGDVEGGAGDDLGLGDEIGGDDFGAGVDTDAQVDQTKLLNQILTLLTAQASAQHAKAEADKAEADVRAAEAAAKAATQYASHQEEVMDMENYNKRQQEEKRENQIQAKLIRYRHDLRKDDGESLEDKLNDPEFLLNTLHKISIGESVNKYQPATPEEEEVLHMEDWEESEKKKKEHMQLRDRLNRFRHARRKTAVSKETHEGAAVEEVNAEEEPKKFDPKTGGLLDYILQQKELEDAQKHNVANQ